MKVSLNNEDITQKSAIINTTLLVCGLGLTGCDATTTSANVGTITPTVSTTPSPAPSTAGSEADRKPQPTPILTPKPTPTSTPSVTPTPAPTPAATPTSNPTAWPDASNTGAKGTLTTRSGEIISTDGTVVQNVQYTGRVTIQANNVTLKNVKVTADMYYGVLIYGKGIKLEDVTVIGNPTAMAGVAVSNNGEFTATRLDVSKVEDGVRLGNNSSLTDSFIHDLSGDASSHYDAVSTDINLTNISIVHNTILNQMSQPSAVYVGDASYSATGTISNNLIAGGGYVIYAGSPSKLVIEDNQFSTRFFPKSGYWGPVAYLGSSSTWSNNKWADGPNAGQLITP